MERDDRRPSSRDDLPAPLADVLAEAARALLEEEDSARVLDKISTLAVETIGSAQHCGITVVAGSEVSTPASTDPVPVLVDQLQYDSGQGPCLDAIRHHEIFASGDITREATRWPVFAARAARETPVRSVMSFRLFANDRTYGAMNVYSQRVDAFTASDQQVGSALAAHAAVALSSAGLVDSLRRALVTRDVISTAKGILMAASDVGADEAFEMLKQASMRENVKLSTIAQRIIDGHPPADLQPPGSMLPSRRRVAATPGLAAEPSPHTRHLRWSHIAGAGPDRARRCLASSGDRRCPMGQ